MWPRASLELPASCQASGVLSSHRPQRGLEERALDDAGCKRLAARDQIFGCGLLDVLGRVSAHAARCRAQCGRNSAAESAARLLALLVWLPIYRNVSILISMRVFKRFEMIEGTHEVQHDLLSENSLPDERAVFQHRDPLHVEVYSFQTFRRSVLGSISNAFWHYY